MSTFITGKLCNGLLSYILLILLLSTRKCFRLFVRVTSLFIDNIKTIQNNYKCIACSDIQMIIFNINSLKYVLYNIFRLFFNFCAIVIPQADPVSTSGFETALVQTGNKNYSASWRVQSMKPKGMTDAPKSPGILFVILCVCSLINECSSSKISDLRLCGDKECKSKWNLIKLARDRGPTYLEFPRHLCFNLHWSIFCDDYLDDILLSRIKLI